MKTVLVLLAADRITGPAKGLFQLFRQAEHTPWAFLLGLFHLRGTEFVSECAVLADEMGIPSVTLEQARRYDPTLVWQAYRSARRHDVALLQSHHYKGHLICLMLRRLTRLPWIGFAHGWTDENRRVRLYNRLELLLLRGADRVVAVSEPIRRRLEAAGVPASRVVVVPNAVEVPCRPPEAPRGSWRARARCPASVPLAAVIGRFSPEKGQDVFIDACRILAERGLPLVGALVGDGLTEAALRQQVRAKGLEACVRFMGYCKDVSAVYRDADLVVIPSRSEGLPNVLLEAMAHGVPVVATAVGGIPGVVRHRRDGHLVPSDDSLALAEAIASLLEDEDARRSLAHNALETVRRHFSPGARADRIFALYRHVAGDGPR